MRTLVKSETLSIVLKDLYGNVFLVNTETDKIITPCIIHSVEDKEIIEEFIKNFNINSDADIMIVWTLIESMNSVYERNNKSKGE